MISRTGWPKKSLAAAAALAAIWFWHDMEKFAHLAANGYWPPSENPRSAQANRRQAAILAEIGEFKGSHDWAGEYGTSSGLSGDSLLVAPKSGYVCNTWYDFSVEEETRRWGSVRQQGPVLHLTGGGVDEPERCMLAQNEMWLARWGPRRYLLAPNRIMAFVNDVNDVNDGSEPRFSGRGFNLLREGDERKPAPGKPILPPGFARGLLSEPIDATVVSVGALTKRTDGDGERISTPRKYPVVLSAGRARGAMNGMEFHSEEISTGWRATVDTVKADSSLAWAVIWGNDPPPKVGEKVSTRPAFRRRKLQVEEPIRLRVRRLSSSSFPPLGDGPWNEYALPTQAAPPDIRLIPVAAIEWFGAAEELYDWKTMIGEMGEKAAAMGANLLILPHDAKPSKGRYPVTATGRIYRVEHAGHPLESEAFSCGNQGWRSAFDWSLARRKSNLMRHSYVREIERARTKVLGRALRMSEEELDRWPRMRIEQLTPNQREALARFYGLKGDRGPIIDNLTGERDSALQTELAAAEKYVRRTMAAAHAEYQRLNEELERDREIAKKKAEAKQLEEDLQRQRKWDRMHQRKSPPPKL